MNYEKYKYKSFLWKFGTTSFRSKEFNRKTEWQLQLIDQFWKKEECQDAKWENNNTLQERYYNWLHENQFTTGTESDKPKAAREKTSGLLDMGLIDNNRRLTQPGQQLLRLSVNMDFVEKTPLGISKDSQLYLSQLLKLSCSETGATVRPFIVILYLMSQLQYLTYDEFRYLMPLCDEEATTGKMIENINLLRSKEITIDEILIDFLLSKPNYQGALRQFCDNAFSQDLLLSVSMNRKSALYDRKYVPLYKELKAVYYDHDLSRIIPLYNAVSDLTLKRKWKTLLFDTSRKAAILNDPQSHLLPLPEQATRDEVSFKRYFFTQMHLFKAKATLEDYMDLNRRYLGLTNCFIFGDEEVKLDIVPQLFFNNAITELYGQAYQSCDLLFSSTELNEISPALAFDGSTIIRGINAQLDINISSLEEAYDEVERLRYERFNQLVQTKFSDDNLLLLLDHFDQRNDAEINSFVTDNADIPTIFEYVLGIIWYKISGCKGKILSYLKLSLDANLLPVTHAAGGEADIVYEYGDSPDYPKHSLLIEATLADSTNQRRMEMEPVSRHLGNHLIRTGNKNSYCVFVSTFLHINVISDFMSRKHMIYSDPQDEMKYIDGMKIIPLSTKDLKDIISRSLGYSILYKHFDAAYLSAERLPKVWYEKYVRIESLQSDV